MSRKEDRGVAQDRVLERAVVVEVKGTSAILLTRSGAFVSRPAANLAVGDVTLVDMTPAGQGRGARSWRFGLAGAVAAVVAVALVLAGVTPAYAKTVAYTSVEINPAFTLGLNDRGRVTSVTAEDADATKVLSALTVVGDSLPVAVNALVRASVADGFVPSSGFTPVIVAAYGKGTSPIPTAIEPVVARAAQSAKEALASLAVKGTAQSVAVAPKVVARARKLGLSVGQYVVLAELQHNGKKVSDKLVREGLGVTIEQSGSETLFQALTNTLAKGPPPSTPGGAKGGDGGAGNGAGPGNGKSGAGNGKGGATVEVQVSVPSGIEGISFGDGGHGHGKGNDKGHGQGKDHGKGKDGKAAQGDELMPPGSGTSVSPGDGQDQSPQGSSGDGQDQIQQGGPGSGITPPASGDGKDQKSKAGSGNDQSGSGASSSLTWPSSGSGGSTSVSPSSSAFCTWLQSFGFSCGSLTGGSQGGDGSSGGD